MASNSNSNSNDPLELHNRAILTYREGHTADAIALMEQALALLPDHVAILSSYGQLLREANRPLQALDAFLRALLGSPQNAAIANAVGVCYQETGDNAKALEYYLRAMVLNPSLAEAYNNIGVILLKEKDYVGAIEHLQQAIGLDRAYGSAYNNLGIAHRNNLDYYASIAAFRRAAELIPDNPGILAGLGEVLGLIYDEAAESTLRQAIQIDPANPEHHWNLALELLKRGDYIAGWSEHELRWQRTSTNQTPLRPFSQPYWRNQPGEDLRGSTILLHSEQGFGDALQMLRYLPLLSRLGAHILLDVPGPLVRLVSSYAEFHEAITVILPGSPFPPFDWHIPTMSLPYAFSSTLDTLPAPLRLTPPVSHRPASEKPLRVGLCWAGNLEHVRDRERSIRLALFRSLFNLAGCTFVSLQVGPAAQQTQATGLDLEQPSLHDFADTAALLDTLDLVISVDTAVAHLAASQGIPTWILLPYVADWRWLRPSSHPGARDPNPWYPQARIFRSDSLPHNGDAQAAWEPVIARVAEELRALCDSR